MYIYPTDIFIYQFLYLLAISIFLKIFEEYSVEYKKIYRNKFL